MACKTCDHTMQNIGTNGSNPIFWCLRCGSIKIRDQHDEPMVVDRFHDFMYELVEGASGDQYEYARASVIECVTGPENRGKYE